MLSISIIIPVYNVERYIAKCINSVIEQTYTGTIECIIIDDCGQDRSKEICKNIINNYVGPIHFHLIEHSENKGVSAARNSGIMAAKGDYLFFLDGDDYLFPNSIETLALLASKYTNVDLIQGNTTGDIEIYPNISLQKHKQDYLDNPLIIDKFLFTECQVTVWNKLYRTKTIKDNDFLFPEGTISEDDYWRLIIHNKIKSLAYTKEITYYYTSRENSYMRDIIDNKNFNSLYINLLNITYLAISTGKFKDSLYSTYKIFFDYIRPFTKDPQLNDDYYQIRKDIISNISSHKNAPKKIRTICHLLKHGCVGEKLLPKLIAFMYPLQWFIIKINTWKSVFHA